MGNPHHDSRGRFSSGGGGGRGKSGSSPAQRIAFAHIGPASTTSNSEMASKIVSTFATGKASPAGTAGTAVKSSTSSSSSSGGLASTQQMLKTNQKMARMRRAQLRATYKAQGKPLPPGLR